MSEVEKLKLNILQNMHRLCAHCVNGDYQHNCPVRRITDEISQIKGVPLIVNDEFKGVFFV